MVSTEQDGSAASIVDSDARGTAGGWAVSMAQLLAPDRWRLAVAVWREADASAQLAIWMVPGAAELLEPSVGHGEQQPAPSAAHQKSLPRGV